MFRLGGQPKGVHGNTLPTFPVSRDYNGKPERRKTVIQPDLFSSAEQNAVVGRITQLSNNHRMKLSMFAEDCNKNAGVDHRASQNSEILAYLEAGNTLTPLEALRKFGCFRLSGRIYDLKKMGYLIATDLITLEDGKRVARYRLA